MDPSTDLWLVRTAKNVISGPHSKTEVIDLVKSGAIGPQDEVCPGNGYWIYLHEHEEVQKWLGIAVPRAPRQPGEEVTETQTDRPPAPSVDAQAEEFLAQQPEAVEQTAVMNASALRAKPTVRPAVGTRGGAPSVSAVRPQPARATVVSHVEKTSVWKGVAFAMVVAAVLIIWTVLRALRSVDY